MDRTNGKADAPLTQVGSRRVRSRAKYRGPICKECQVGFYYDFIPEPHDGTGLCRECWESRNVPGPQEMKESEE